ncbi:MAG: sensor histidine kinase [Planctomyces sp.]|nr:sensor histidine kinase [Planctomyces sp.]
MTLVHRVSWFFLIALGICLTGYSLVVYVLIRESLFRQFDEPLASALNGLVAAVEAESDAVKWQPTEHTIEFGGERHVEDVRWVIVDPRGNVVDHSRNLNPAIAKDSALIAFWTERGSKAPGGVAAPPWRVLRKQLAATTPKPDDEMEFDEFSSMTIFVVRHEGRLLANLWRLLAMVTLLPAFLWILAAIIGRWYCRAALAPLGEMSRRAASMTGADFHLRLPVAPRRDELADLAAAFNGLLSQLQQAFEKQQRFTGDAAHQLRTPLTILRGEIDVALRRPREGHEYRDALTKLSNQTNELQQIVETLLYLARATGESTPPAVESLPLDEWLPHYLQRWRGHPRWSDLSLHVPPGTTVWASPPLLNQALDNLVGNAFKYSTTGTPVTISTEDREGSIHLIIDDAGCGIAESERAAVFEPFYRSPQARKAGIEGTGLGLSLVAAIARSMEGEVHCEGRTPHGTRFVLQLRKASPPTPQSRFPKPEAEDAETSEVDKD